MEEPSSKRRLLSSAGSVALGSALISLSPFAVELSGLDALANTFYRMGIGGLLLLLLSLSQIQERFSFRFLGLCFLGALIISLDLFIWNQSVLYIGPGLATVLANLEMVFLALIGTLFYRERLPRYFFGLCLLICAGVCSLIHPYFLEIQWTHSVGIAFGLLASLIYGLYLLLLKTVRLQFPQHSPMRMLSVICLMGAGVLGVYMMFVSPSSFYVTSWGGFLCVLSNGILSQAVGWLLIATGIKKVSLSLSGLLMLSQPALTFLIDCCFFGRNTHWLQILGCMLLLVAVYCTSIEEKNKEVPA